MFKENKKLHIPAEDTIIWKYLDLSKFLDLLISEKLFMARSDKFEDQYEGTFSEPTYEEIKKLLEDNPEYLDAYKSKRKNIVISSWHANSYESYAMWQVFTKNNEGLAIQSTVGRLKESLTEPKADQYIGEVNYIDYKKEHIPFDDDFFPFLFKRKSFQYENEIRVITDVSHLDLHVNEGVKIETDINQMIERLYIHPKSENWYKKLVIEVVNQLGYRFDIEKSDLESDILI
ncbi:DUF2971 domain-containing protein [Avrilella dinanensis]|uniref:DUF2971 domain-containing protein n=1 Tax=Avrilella dinanensis TaxID=2008672 RepID=A0A2M9R7Z4_9FLAO|nr:DUF2971 domain-containing protein [Avrilella dinanensis]PJR04987.1 hypothetical protein CDL10_10850 [Avrilella dinanensis]